MAIVPDTYIGKITFYEAHIAAWTAQATSVGLTDADCVALASLITAARSAYNNQQAALSAARGATAAMHAAVRAMHTLGSADIARIKAYAEETGDMGVFAKAEIPAPASPSPVGPPGTPTDFTVTLMQSGAITLRWKCANPVGGGGTSYRVQRRIGTGPFTQLGIVGARAFTDETIPAGSSGVVYQITAFRSTTGGTPAQFNVNFGVGGDGMVFATVSPVTAVKMAA